jgi:chitin synthase
VVESPISLISAGLTGVVATLGIQGWQFNISTALVPATGPDFYTLASTHSGQDITPFFVVPEPASCANLDAQVAVQNLCYAGNGFGGCPLGDLDSTTLNALQLYNTSKSVGFSWDQIGILTNALVINGIVLNMDAYMNANPDPITNDTVDGAIRTILRRPNSGPGGRDATHMFESRSELKEVIPCLSDKYGQGIIDRETAGCFFSDVLLYVTLVVIFALVLVRFVMACVFSWFISWKLSKTPKITVGGKRWSPYMDMNFTPTKPKPAKRSPKKGPEMVEMRDVDPFLDRWEYNSAENTPTKPTKGLLRKSPSKFDDWSSSTAIATQLYTILMVTAYSEGEAGLLGTISSLSETQYSDERKLIIVVCDGIVCGQGESRTTPDIVVSLMQHDYEAFGEPSEQLYLSVGAGEKAINRAKVYAGYFTPRGENGRRTPMMCIVKTGIEDEKVKHGNRGKRDSQMIVAGWLNRVMYNERMSPLDYDIFGKAKELMGLTPDCFELLLMVCLHCIWVTNGRLMPIREFIRIV